jgi:TRAP-type transport system small permease protein
MNQFVKYLTKISVGICKIFLVIQILIVVYVVFGRYVLRSTPGWGEESALFAMIWFSLLSATVAVGEDSHIKITLIDFIAKGWFNLALCWLSWIIIFIVALFMVIQGYQLAALTFSNIMPGIGIPSGWLYMSVPFAGVAMILQLIGQIGNIGKIGQAGE